MSAIPLFEISNIYEFTTLILGIASLMMGVTIFMLRSVLRHSGARSKLGLAFLSLSLLWLSVINLVEYIIGADIKHEQYSLSIVIFAASMETFLLFAAYASMLCPKFITRRRIYIELGCIAIFTLPVLFFSPTINPLLFYILFCVSIVFYIVKFLYNYFEIRCLVVKKKTDIESFFSNDSNLWLKWIINTYYVILAIGILSVIVAMTNLIVLTCYNVAVMLAFFYIYRSIIYNIPMFDRGMSILENESVESCELRESGDGGSPTTGRSLKPTECFTFIRHKLLDDWVVSRGYAESGVTATEVAVRLKTNRTRLSYYLKSELNMTYYEWIAMLRIEDAKRQLVEHPDRAIYEVALNVGIEDRDNFRHVFQRYAGMSPTAYRKKYFRKN